MEAQDLRIGNIVQDKKYKSAWRVIEFYGTESVQLDAGKVDFATDDLHDEEMSNLEPIELTEDWLKRLGCIEQRINSTKKNYWNKEKDFSVDVEFSFSGNLYYYNVSKDRRKPLIHVHKLQNLHYELKDEELKIK